MKIESSISLYCWIMLILLNLILLQFYLSDVKSGERKKNNMIIQFCTNHNFCLPLILTKYKIGLKTVLMVLKITQDNMQ